MNYYSRSSPKKRKRILPAGFLLENKVSRSSQTTHRQKLKSRFNISSHQSQKQLEDPNSGHMDVLTTSRQQIFIQSNNQILIQQQSSADLDDFDQQNLSKQLKQALQYSKELSQNLNQQKVIEQQQKHQQNQQQKASQDSKLDSQQKQITPITNQGKIQIHKQFFRNYSFGDKQFSPEKAPSGNVRKQPLIKKLLNIQPSLNLFQNAKFIRKQQKITNQNILMQSQNYIVRKAPKQETWNKLVKNFIKKRENTANNLQDDNIWITNDNIVQQNREETNAYVGEDKKLQNNIRQSDKFSQKSAYFNNEKKSESFHSSEVTNQFQYHTHSNRNKGLQPRQNVHYSATSNQIYIDEQQTGVHDSQNDRKKDSIILFEQAIMELPQKLIPYYRAMQKQLLRRQHQNEVILKRMEETQSMIKLLIQTQKRQICVENYILNEHRSPDDEVIAGNIQIILSLVRQLACFY